jgi:quercetin dioxygenase-like cupin family protein
MSHVISSLNYVRLYSDPSGESHFADEEFGTKTTDFAPPAAPLNLSEYISAKKAFLVAPEGWVGDWHPAPHRQFMILLHGEIESQVSDGEVRNFKQGDIVLLEDTTGKGHTSRSLRGDAIIAVVERGDG